MRCYVALLGCLFVQAARAEGFANQDLTTLLDRAKAAIGSQASVQATPLNLTATCSRCKGAPTVSIELGRLTDGTEKRVRSGATSFAKLEALCLAQNPDCRLSAIPVSPAIGWITVYAYGSDAGSTAVILNDGDLLTIRAKAGSRGSAEDTVRALTAALVPKIVGP